MTEQIISPRKWVILSYLSEGKDHSFEFNLANDDHCGRIMATIKWAARTGIEIQMVPMINHIEAQKALEQIAS